MSWFEVANELLPKIRVGDTQAAITRISAELKSLPHGPFHQILQLDFANQPKDIATHFDAFLKKQKSQFTVGAVYTETNGFDINPDRWYFDVFAYREYGGYDDYDWLSNWDSGSWPDMPLIGLEPLQEVYGSMAFRDQSHHEASEFCSLLVVAKFQDLIRRSLSFMRMLDVPLLATSHDYDFIAELKK